MILYELIPPEKSIISLDTWGELVEAYSKCNMTNPQDKLVALSGLAAAAQHSFGENVCGMWRQFLTYELL